jgi:hypothetical protein
MISRRITLNHSTRNKNVKVAYSQNLHETETAYLKALNRNGQTCLEHICIILYTTIAWQIDLCSLLGGRDELKLITLYLPETYLKLLDQLVDERFYPNRAEAIRVAIRDLINAEVWQRSRVG